MNWEQTCLDLAIGAIGGICATFATYWKAREELKGQHNAMYKNIEFLLAKHRAESYQQEKGKQAATHEDIENVLGDLKLVTEKAETIKASIGMDAWTRQMVWNQKRDAYRTILRLVNDHLETLSNLKAYREGVWRGARREGINLSVVTPIPNEIDDKMLAYIDTHRRLTDELREAFVFLPPTATSLLNECLLGNDFGKAFGTLDQRGNLDRSPAEQTEINAKTDNEINFIANWMGRLIFFAREDLGVNLGG